jgi:tetratricopeptide (TPR) repeat protein
MRANDAERDYPRAIRLLREAVAIDSNFAEGWRKLAVALRNGGGLPPSVADSAITRAYQLRDRMTERERDAVLAYYYSGSPGYDRAKAIATYERMLARGDSLVALNNMAGEYRKRREFAKAESLYRAAIAIQPSLQIGVSNLISVLVDQAKLAQADSAVAEARKRFPTATVFNQVAINRLFFEGRFDEGLRALDSARKKGDPRFPSWAISRLSNVATQRGRFRESRDLARQARAIDSAAGRPAPEVFLIAQALNDVHDAGAPFEAQLKAFDDAVGLTGLVVTKLDGTARGGVLAALVEARRDKPLPILFIGVGESIDDLQPFVARDFADALVGLA